MCIYCGWDGGEKGLRSEHIVPYSLGGNTELLGASCSECEKVTSYLDGYMANAVFGHFRVHTGIQSRRGHPNALPLIVEHGDGRRVIDLATENHPFFLNMPIWRLPGAMRGADISEDFGFEDKHVYWYVPENIRDSIGLKDGDVARIMDSAPRSNLRTFARGLVKIAYCNGVMKYGLDGFRPLVTTDIILGKYINIPYFVGCEREPPPPPYQRGIQHSVSLGYITYQRLKLLTATIRLFSDSGTKENGMPFYHVIYGAEGRRKVIPQTPLPKLPRSISL